jgi:hypothetical protein
MGRPGSEKGLDFRVVRLRACALTVNAQVGAQAGIEKLDVGIVAFALTRLVSVGFVDPKSNSETN